jgi:isoleucyl-tRNA synthetase
MALYRPQDFEKEVLKFWEKDKSFDKLRKKNAKGPRWSFIDGPITANNSMGIHHVWGRSVKDLYQRHRAMQGFHQRYQNGFDCQGLWVEREVEKDLGFKGKEDIEKFGIKNFVEACRARVDKFSTMQTKQSIRLGQWMDWKNSYYTMSDISNEYKWMFLKECYKKKWLYKGIDSVPWCSRCTSMESKHAISTEGYEEVEDTAVFMQFPVSGKKDEFFLVWTTTPWTVPANVALAVHPDLYYVQAKVDSKTYILAENLAESVLGKRYEILNKFLGMDLVGQAYEMPYKDLPAQKSSIICGAKSAEDVGPAPHIVVEWTDEVSDEEGTGIVHIAPGCGPEDHALGKRERFPAPSPLNEFGRYTMEYGWLAGKSSTEMNERIVKDLDKRGFLYKKEKYTHRYPHCTRCRTPLVFRVIPAWYISMDEIRPKLIAENKKINWVPAQGRKYEEAWLNNMSDWLISRKRYWGLPLPIWECECGNIEVIGSKAELKKKASSGYAQLKELHRPWVDNVKVKCSACGKSVKRIVDTGDVWLDAGMVPFFTLDWLNDKKKFNEWYPADFVTECGPGQYRLWFYAMILHGVALTGTLPFKNVATHEVIKDEKGREMHKSWGNAIWFDDAIVKVGADVMRWLYATNAQAKEVRFGWNTLKEKQRTLNVLWNFTNYVQLNLGNKKPVKPTKMSAKARWILSRLESLKALTTENLNKYTHPVAAGAIENFFLNDLSRTYGQMIRDEVDKKETQYVMYTVTSDLLKILAPFVPFTTEKLYQDIFKKYEKKTSIHLFDWPKVDAKLIDLELEKEFEIVSKTISLILSAREKANRGVRWPVKEVTVTYRKKIVKDAILKHAELIKQLTNVLSITTKTKLQGLEYNIKLNFTVAGPKFGNNVTKVVSYLVRTGADSIVKHFYEEPKYKITLSKSEVVELERNDVIIEEKLPADIVGAKEKNFGVYLTLEETKDMIAQGFMREVARKVQALRKKAGLEKTDKINLQVVAPVDIAQDLKGYGKEIANKVGASKMEFTSRVSTQHSDSFNIRGKKIEVGLDKI